MENDAVSILTAFETIHGLSGLLRASLLIFTFLASARLPVRPNSKVFMINDI